MRHSVCRGACEIIVAPGLPVLLEGGEQHVRAIGTLASLSSCSCERLPPPPWATQASPPSSQPPPPLRDECASLLVSKNLPVKALPPDPSRSCERYRPERYRLAADQQFCDCRVFARSAGSAE